jgi:hypothetical protein
LANLIKELNYIHMNLSQLNFINERDISLIWPLRATECLYSPALVSKIDMQMLSNHLLPIIALIHLITSVLAASSLIHLTLSPITNPHSVLMTECIWLGFTLFLDLTLVTLATVWAYLKLDLKKYRLRDSNIIIADIQQQILAKLLAWQKIPLQVSRGIWPVSGENIHYLENRLNLLYQYHSFEDILTLIKELQIALASIQQDLLESQLPLTPPASLVKRIEALPASQKESFEQTVVVKNTQLKPGQKFKFFSRPNQPITQEKQSLLSPPDQLNPTNLPASHCAQATFITSPPASIIQGNTNTSCEVNAANQQTPIPDDNEFESPEAAQARDRPTIRAGKKPIRR